MTVVIRGMFAVVRDDAWCTFEEAQALALLAVGHACVRINKIKHKLDECHEYTAQQFAYTNYISCNYFTLGMYMKNNKGIDAYQALTAPPPFRLSVYI